MRAALPLAAALALALTAGCGALKSMVSSPSTTYSLAGARSGAEPSAAAATLTLTVSPPQAAAGYDSPRMMYTRRPGQLEYFAQNEWVDTPARMIAPLIIGAIEDGGGYRAVVRMPSSAAGDLRLDTEILRLQQDFLVTPSQVRFMLRANLVESATRRVMATQEFEASIPADSENARGGAAAANRAVQAVLLQLAAFCKQGAAR
jgi:cholesterol transport system auxiliary component